jgi:hypothetical protein
MSTKYDWLVSLESVSGFVLDTDQLDTGVLGYLTTPLTDPRVKIRSVSMQGGRNRELEAVKPSTATVVFDNRDGLFSPENTSSPYYGSTFPGKKIVVDYVSKIGGRYERAFFSGFISDWSWDFDINGDAIATVSATDTLGLLATINISNLSVPVEDTGARIARICAAAGLDASQYDPRVNVAQGQSIMAATTLTGNALQLIQDTVFHEQGVVFAYDGVIRFGQRGQVYQTTGYLTNVTGGPQPAFFYSAAEMGYSLDSVSNPVTTTSTLGTATAVNTSNVGLYGDYSRSYETEFSTFAQQDGFTKFLVNFYSTPEFRPSSLTFSFDRILADDVQNGTSYWPYFLFLSTYFSATVQVTFVDSARGMNTNSNYLVSSFSHSSTPTSYNVSIGFEQEIAANWFRLDFPELGVLDTNILGF